MSKQPKKSKVKPPITSDEWQSLLQTVLQRATRSNDRRVAGLKQALVTGNVEGHLRKMGIICQEDILREFPEKDEEN